MTDSKTWPTLALIHSCRLWVLPSASTYLSLRAITSMQVTMTTGSESQEAQPPMKSTTRRMRSAMRTVAGCSAVTAAASIVWVIGGSSTVADAHQPQRELREGDYGDEA